MFRCSLPELRAGWMMIFRIMALCSWLGVICIRWVGVLNYRWCTVAYKSGDYITTTAPWWTIIPWQDSWRLMFVAKLGIIVPTR